MDNTRSNTYLCVPLYWFAICTLERSSFNAWHMLWLSQKRNRDSDFCFAGCLCLNKILLQWEASSKTSKNIIYTIAKRYTSNPSQIHTRVPSLRSTHWFPLRQLRSHHFNSEVKYRPYQARHQPAVTFILPSSLLLPTISLLKRAVIAQPCITEAS